MVDEVDEKTFDVRAIVVLTDGVRLSPIQRNGGAPYLISHDHQTTVSQSSDVFVVMPTLQPHNLLDVGNLEILHDGVMAGFANV